jgi:hypothetical protein
LLTAATERGVAVRFRADHQHGPNQADESCGEAQRKLLERQRTGAATGCGRMPPLRRVRRTRWLRISLAATPTVHVLPRCRVR